MRTTVLAQGAWLDVFSVGAQVQACADVEMESLPGSSPKRMRHENPSFREERQLHNIESVGSRQSVETYTSTERMYGVQHEKSRAREAWS